MDVIEKYNNYPYKRVFVCADAFGYPLEIIEKIMGCYEMVSNIDDEIYELLTQMVIKSLNYHLNYEFTNEEEFLNKVSELSKNYVKNQGSYIDIATKGILNNYTFK